MKDFPVFTTENGVASLVLREVPYKGIAFVTLQDTLCPEKLLKECVDFCRAVGAEKVYATGHDVLKDYPQAVTIYRMKRLQEGIGETDAALFPVTEKTIDRFRDLYNERMACIPTAASMTREDGEKLLLRGAGYFVHRGENLLGIGIVAGDTVEAIAGLHPGVGADVMRALCSVVYAETVVLEVASTNKPALRLYEKLGFCKTAELLCWYDVINCS